MLIILMLALLLLVVVLMPVCAHYQYAKQQRKEAERQGIDFSFKARQKALKDADDLLALPKPTTDATPQAAAHIVPLAPRLQRRKNTTLNALAR
ncbi:MAG TPA: hypothetical protein DD979_16275 [Gammaproteobacteria bacterium]|jgi:Tfp pilus assembly protein PilX|nr:hypothetical protein [Gammaproteobacteria bacterium]